MYVICKQRYVFGAMGAVETEDLLSFFYLTPVHKITRFVTPLPPPPLSFFLRGARRTWEATRVWNRDMRAEIMAQHPDWEVHGKVRLIDACNMGCCYILHSVFLLFIEVFRG